MYFQTMSFLVLAVAGLRPGDGAVRVGNNNYDMNDDNVITNVDERFLKSVSHHYCDRLTGTHVVLLPENKSSVSFYKVLLRYPATDAYVNIYHVIIVFNALRLLTRRCQYRSEFSSWLLLFNNRLWTHLTRFRHQDDNIITYRCTYYESLYFIMRNIQSGVRQKKKINK